MVLEEENIDNINMVDSIGGDDPAKKIGSVGSLLSKSSSSLNKKYGGSEKEPEEEKIKLKDIKGLKSGAYSKKHIEGIIKASKALGVDPYQALALAWQESGFAHPTGKKGRRGGAIVEDLSQIMDFEPAQEKELQQKAKDTGIDPQYLRLGIVLRDKLKYAKQLGFKDEASQLQAYNGYGTLTPKQFGGATKAYGVDISQGISMKKNPLYGKRLLELKKSLSGNEDIKKLLEMETPPPSASPTPSPSPTPEPLGGDEDEKKAKERIPLPDYKNPESRLDYAKQFTQKYGSLMSGRGDTPLRINEIPASGKDKLTSKQIALNASGKLGLDPALLYSSAMEEGMSGLYPDKNNQVNYSGDENYPVSGYQAFGLDTFSDAFPELVKKGYLPKEFEKEFKKNVEPPKEGDNKTAVNSANFSSAEAGMQAKAAMIKAGRDELDDFTSKNNIKLSDKAKDFFTLIGFNAGPSNAKKMLKEYNSMGVLKNDSFLKKRPSKSWAVPYENAIRRIQMADALKAEGYFDEGGQPNPSPAPAPQTNVAESFDMFEPKEFIN